MNNSKLQTSTWNSMRKGTLNLSQEQWFMVSVLIVNAGNYAYNLILGRMLGPERYAEAALLITFLLVLSFVAMTLQLTVAKFQAEESEAHSNLLVNFFKQRALVIGGVVGLLVVGSSWWLADIFHVSSPAMFQFFGLCIPFYFIMSVYRGVHQGGSQFIKLSLSYQGEMWTKLLGTLLLLVIFPSQVGVCIAVGIIASVTIGLFPRVQSVVKTKHSKLPNDIKQTILKFALFTACYELSQILINNSDILMVKHYFDSESAGLYAALAMIGRVVYFLAWMFVMLLLPQVISLEKEGKDSRPLLKKYVGYTALIGVSIVISSYFLPELIISILFGSAYLEISNLLWLYALATSAFAVANIYVYYALSLSRYLPIFITVGFGILQVVLVSLFHGSMYQVVIIQVIAMLTLLITQVAYFRYSYL